MTSDAELKRQPGAYLSLRGRLYCVLGPQPCSMLIEVENALTLHRSSLTPMDVTASALVKASPIDTFDTQLAVDAEPERGTE